MTFLKVCDNDCSLTNICCIVRKEHPVQVSQMHKKI